MKLTIKDKKDNSLLHRLEITADLIAEGATPSNEQIKKELASQLKTDEKLVVVKHIYSKFGSDQADVLAYLYNDEAAMKRIEFIKEPVKKPEKKKEAPAQAKPEEKPAEAPKTKEKKE